VRSTGCCSEEQASTKPSTKGIRPVRIIERLHPDLTDTLVVTITGTNLLCERGESK
jgi:hypothetical protein